MNRTKKSLSQHWKTIQLDLFPALEDAFGPLSERHRKLISIFEMARPEVFLRTSERERGRPPVNRASLVRTFLAKALFNLPTTSMLIDLLKSDRILRQLCGFSNLHLIPSESTFSRAFAEFASQKLPEKLHESLIITYRGERLVGHISRDATAIEARESVLTKEKPEEKEAGVPKKRGRPKKGEEPIPKEPTRLERQQNMELPAMLEDLPNRCDRGTKKNSKGFKVSWKGYKLHLDVADGDIPMSALLTSASVHDSQAALPLATLTAQRVTSLYDLMDKAYDSEIIRQHSQALGHVPLIAFRKRRSEQEIRAFMPHEKQRYKARSSAERVNARLKDDLGGLMIRVRGALKVMAHLMFGVVALTVEQLVRFAI